MKKNYNIKDFLSSAIFYLTILTFIIGFNFSDTPPPFGWYQQFMPNLNNQPISDVFFLDSLTGWAVTNDNLPQDTGYILKTTNSGDNWVIKFQDRRDFGRIKFIDTNTGFACGGTGSGTSYLYKSTNGGDNWFTLPVLGNNFYTDMSVLDNNTIWLVDPDGLLGGVYLTTNGGVSWTRQLNLSSENPRKIYMYNRNFGFVSSNVGDQLYRTMNGGNNWSFINGTDGFSDMKFIDTLTGWKCNGNMKKTTDGGLSWATQALPHGGIISVSSALKMSFIGRDTIWAVGGYVEYPNLQDRGILFRTTNGGTNWLFQVPDTTIHLAPYKFVQFITVNTGWAYVNYVGGIHTTTGGDPGWIADVKQISNIIPKEFKLYQNYPNPFNPTTIIRYQIVRLADIRLVVYDITGKEKKVLVNQEQNVGTYQVDFSGVGISSGVYFYSLIVDGKSIDTKKFIMIK